MLKSTAVLFLFLASTFSFASSSDNPEGARHAELRSLFEAAQPFTVQANSINQKFRVHLAFWKAASIEDESGTDCYWFTDPITKNLILAVDGVVRYQSGYGFFRLDEKTNLWNYDDRYSIELRMKGDIVIFKVLSPNNPQPAYGYEVNL